MNPKRITLLLILFTIVFSLTGCGFTAIKLNPDVPVTGSTEPDYPKAIVVFDSWSGNTALVAEIIAERLNAPAVPVAEVSNYEMTDFDLIVVGSPVHGGRPTAKIKDFLAELPKPRMSAAFVTFGAPLFGPMTANACLKKMEKSLQGTSLGRFKCHGFHKVLRTYPSHPDQNDIVEAQHFAAGILEHCLSTGDND